MKNNLYLNKMSIFVCVLLFVLNTVYADNNKLRNDILNDSKYILSSESFNNILKLENKEIISFLNTNLKKNIICSKINYSVEAFKYNNIQCESKKLNTQFINDLNNIINSHIPIKFDDVKIKFSNGDYSESTDIQLDIEMAYPVFLITLTLNPVDAFGVIKYNYIIKNQKIKNVVYKVNSNLIIGKENTFKITYDYLDAYRNQSYDEKLIINKHHVGLDKNSLVNLFYIEDKFWTEYYNMYSYPQVIEIPKKYILDNNQTVFDFLYYQK